jgi:phospholipase/lecithinase/hemolysin
MAAAGLAIATPAVSAAPFSSLVVFGDSLSDNGNFFQATGGAFPQAANYANGRFSNGSVAVEYLAQGLGVSLKDYAYGGAESGYLNVPAVAWGLPAAIQNTGVRSQIGFFQADLAGSAADANALYLLWAGPNDFERLGYSVETAQTVIQNLSASVVDLYALGARNFMMPGLADMGAIPQGLASGVPALLQQFSLGFNQGLTGAIEQLRAMPGAKITYFDTFATQHALMVNAGNYGISNVSDACFTGFVGEAGSTCADPSSYMYWDKIHPSAITHQILGQGMLAAVPEPQSMLMMAAGLLALLAVRRKSRA